MGISRRIILWNILNILKLPFSLYHGILYGMTLFTFAKGIHISKQQLSSYGNKWNKLRGRDAEMAANADITCPMIFISHFSGVIYHYETN
jgi:hypothetical protein